MMVQQSIIQREASRNSADWIKCASLSLQVQNYIIVLQLVIKNYRITGKGGRKKLAIALRVVLALSYLTLTLTVYIENESALEAASCK